MYNNDYKRFEEIDYKNIPAMIKLEDGISKAKRKCKCGHTQLVYRKKNSEYVLCTYCNGRLYFDDNKQVIYNKKIEREKFKEQLNLYLNISSTKIVDYD